MNEPVIPALALPDIPFEDDGHQPEIAPRFYKSGGTLSPNDPSYVVREADTQLADGLRQGLFCYVLTSRQMGKSSLMTRVSTILQKEDVRVAELDLTTIGQNLTLSEWYDGLIYEIGRRLRIKPVLNKCWLDHSELGPLHRFVTTLQEGLLDAVPGRIVIFIDEIEVVRSLAFSTDEFFAAIRECYNRRATDPEMNRLTFCLLGMATPPDLIRDTRTTPFNIGRRIELADFKPEEARPLARGLRSGGRDGERLLNRVMHWTNGHPYLTQKMCEAVAADESVRTPRDVDTLCRRLFLSPQARETEANLVPVREYILRTVQDRTAVLELYQRVRRARPSPPFESSDPVANVVHLSGISRVQNGHLVVRNRIYDHVFSEAWVQAQLPDAELVRQRQAFRRGLLRAGSVFGPIAAVMAALAGEAAHQRNLALESEQYTKNLLDVTNMNLANEALGVHNASQVLDILNANPQQKTARFEFGYLWHMTHLERTICHSPKDVEAVAYNRPADRLYTASADDGIVRVWNAATGQPLDEISLGNAVAECLAASPDGRWLAVGGSDGNVSIFSLKDDRPVQTLHTGDGISVSIAFSPDSRQLATGTEVGVKVWDTSSWKLTRSLMTGDLTYAIAFRPYSHMIATAARNTKVDLWDTTSGTRIRSYVGQLTAAHSLAFSPDGSKLVAGCEDGIGLVWGTDSGLKLHSIANDQQIAVVKFAPSGRELITGGDDATIKFWNVGSEQMTYAIHGHTGSIRAIAVSQDGRWLATGARDKSARVWDMKLRSQDFVQLQHSVPQSFGPVLSASMPLAIGIDDKERLKVWNTDSGRPIIDLNADPNHINALAFADLNGKAVTLDSGGLSYYSTDSGKLFYRVAMHLNTSGVIAVSRDLGAVAVADRQHPPQIFRVATGTTTDCNLMTDGPVASLAFSPDGLQMAVGDNAGVVSLCDTRSGRVIATLPGRHRGAVAALAYSPDGSTLASGSIYGSIKLFNIPMRHDTLTLNTKSGRSYLRSLTFTTDGKTLRAVDADGGVREWKSDSRPSESTE